MNIVFYLILIIMIICLWFCLTFLFKPIGAFITKIFKDTVDVMTEDENELN